MTKDERDVKYADEQYRFKKGMVSKDGCLLWTKGGRFMVDGKYERVYKASYIIYVDDIPKGCSIRRTCGNTSCVNPSHLMAVEWKNANKRESITISEDTDSFLKTWKTRHHLNSKGNAIDDIVYILSKYIDGGEDWLKKVSKGYYDTIAIK